MRRLLLIATALLLAVVGTSLIFAYSNGRSSQAVADDELLPVLVATQAIPAGTTGQQAIDQGLVKLQDVPARLVPAGALVDIATVQDQEASTDIVAGEILLPTRFLASGVAGELEIPDDKVAVSLELAEAQRVAGFVRPGSEVAVFVTYDTAGGGTLPADGTAAEIQSATRILVPRATVVAVGPTAVRVYGAGAEQAAEDGGTGKDPAALVTLAVAIEDAQRLAHSGTTGTATLALLNEDSRTGPLPADDYSTLFSGQGQP